MNENAANTFHEEEKTCFNPDNTIIIDQKTINSRYAFVTFLSRDQAESAREGLNGATVAGQQIKVYIDRN